MMPDYPLGQTIDFKFTTRAFATGIPTTLAGTPVIQIYEDNSVTQITAGITLTVDFDSVTGLHNLRVVATSGNGFGTNQSYHCVISTGTVGGVSVAGEVVAQFSIERSSAFARLGAPAGASVSVDIANVPTVTELNARTLVAANYFDPATDAVANVTLVATTTTNTDMRGTDGVDTTAMRGTDSAALAASFTFTVAGIVDSNAQYWNDVVISTALQTAADVRTEMDSNSTQLAAIVADTNELQTDDYPARFDGIEGATFDTTTDSNEAIRNRGDTAWLTGAGGSSPTVVQIRQEIDSNSTQLSAIVADTNELQTDDIPARLTGIEGATFATSTDSLEAVRNRGDAAWTTGAGGSSPTVEQIRAEMDANSTQFSAIVADTNELQGDWVNGGRLDLILDIIAADTTTDIPALIAALNDIAATEIVSAGAITTLAGAVVNVDTVDVNSDMRGTDGVDTATMRGTDSSALASVCTEARLAELDAANLPATTGTVQAKTDQLTFTKTNELDGNMQSINGATVTGDGGATPWDGA